MTKPQKPRRPSLQESAALEALADRTDPVERLHLAHETAAALLRIGHAATDPAVTQRLVALSEEIGLAAIADLWAAQPARSLPGALWRLYVVREWVVADAEGVAREYTAGVPLAEAPHVVAGIDWPKPEEVRRTADEILRGAFTGDFAMALDRAAAFCRVVSAGRADLGEPDAEKLVALADDLTDEARLWRRGELE